MSKLKETLTKLTESQHLPITLSLVILFLSLVLDLSLVGLKKIRLEEAQIYEQIPLTPPIVVSPEPTALFWEAEAGTLTSPFHTHTSGGITYVVQDSNNQTNPSSAGKATYNFYLPQAGSYLVQATVNIPNDSANSFFVNIDSGTANAGGFNVNGASWTEQAISWSNGAGDTPNNPPHIFNLAAGNHTLIFRGREAGTKLDKVRLEQITSTTTPSPSASPTQTTPVPSVAPSPSSSCLFEGSIGGGLEPDSPVCCPGLAQISCAANPPSCLLPLMPCFICTSLCGNGVCGPKENSCNCPADCPFSSPIPTSPIPSPIPSLPPGCQWLYSSCNPSLASCAPLNPIMVCPPSPPPTLKLSISAGSPEILSQSYLKNDTFALYVGKSAALETVWFWLEGKFTNGQFQINIDSSTVPGICRTGSCDVILKTQRHLGFVLAGNWNFSGDTQNLNFLINTPLLVGDLYPQKSRGGDEVINSFDVTYLLTQMGKKGVADLNNDGVINTIDYAILKKNFGKTGPIYKATLETTEVVGPCKAVACGLNCPTGLATDPSGCPICQCRPIP